MTNVMTTRLSSKGQIVLPEAIREMNGWGVGTSFTLMMYKGSVIMQPILVPSEAELADEFEEAFAESRHQAKAAGMQPIDIKRVIAKTRASRRKAQVA